MYLSACARMLLYAVSTDFERGPRAGETRAPSGTHMRTHARATHAADRQTGRLTGRHTYKHKPDELDEGNEH